MKRVNFFLIAAFVAASAMLFVSCDKEEDELDNPSISVTAKVGDKSKVPVVSNGSVQDEPGTMVTLDIVYTMGKDPLTKVKLTSKIGDRTQATVLDSTLNEGMFNPGAKEPVSFTYVTSISNEDEVLTLTATDKKNRETPFTLTIRFKESDPEEGDEDDEYDYFISAATTFGAQKNATYPSFYNLTVGKTMMLSDAKLNQKQVDLAFFFRNADQKASVGCPADDVAGDISFGNTKMNTWTAANRNTVNFINYEYNPDFPPSDGFWLEFTTIFEGSTALPTKQVDLSNPRVVEGVQYNDMIFFKKGDIIGAFIVDAVPSNDGGFFKVRFISRELKEID